MITKLKLRNISRILLIFLIFISSIGCRESVLNEEVKPLGLGQLFASKDLQLLGEKLFFDENLSDPEGQSCATCHGPEVGWTGPDEEVNKTGGVYPGALHERYGNRKPNSSAYASLSPLFHAFIEDGKVVFAGGNFWDGRATGYKLGNPAADQAQGPFLNPVEQNISDAKSLIAKVIESDYASLFLKVGKDIWHIDNIAESDNTDLQYGIIGIAIAAYENSEKVNQFSSRYDYFLMGKVQLTEKEKKGLELFEGKAKCSLCHTSKPGPDGSQPLFTDFTFDNVGIPGNPENPWYKMDTALNKIGNKWIDPGLAEVLLEMPQYAMYAGENYGRHQVPTLRNVDKRPSEEFVKAYGHNGYFKSLEAIIHFYNTRDILPAEDAVTDPKPGINCWPKPEVSQNLNKTETGNLGLSSDEESDIVEFLKTLSDGYNLK